MELILGPLKFLFELVKWAVELIRGSKFDDFDRNLLRQINDFLSNDFPDGQEFSAIEKKFPQFEKKEELKRYLTRANAQVKIDLDGEHWYIDRGNKKARPIWLLLLLFSALLVLVYTCFEYFFLVGCSIDFLDLSAEELAGLTFEELEECGSKPDYFRHF